MPRPIAYKTGTIQPPNTAKQSNILVGVGPSNWGAGAANATFYNGLDSSYQYVIIKNSNPPAMWGTGDFTTGSLLTTINGLPDRVGQTRFTNTSTAISWSLASGEYSILKNEQPYGGPITNGLLIDFNPKVNNYFANGDFAYGTTIGWVAYGGTISIADITNDRPYVGSKSTKALQNIGGGFTWGRYTNPVYGPGGLLVVGNTYTFSFWAKVISGPNFDINWNNQNGSGDVSSWTAGNYSVTTTWQKYTQTFTYNISKNFLYIAGSYAANTQYIITEMQLEDGTTANAFSSFPVTAAGWDIPNNGLINSSSFSLTNGPYLNADANGNITFDGVDDYVNCGTPLTFTDSFTLNLWFKTTNTDAIRVITGMYNGSGADWWIGLLTNNTFNFSFGSPSKSDISSSMTVNDGSWRYASCVYNKSNNSIFLYVNATLQSSSSLIPSTVTQPGGNLTIGRFGDLSAFYWPGSIGDYNLYNRALSASEIENLYTADLPTYYPTSSIVSQGLTVYYDFSNPNCYPGSGTTIYDLSGYNNNGTLINGTSFDTTSGGALVFDGVDDYVQFTSTYAGTICFWGIMDANIVDNGALVGVTATGDGALRQSNLSFRGVAGPPLNWNGGDGNDYQFGYPNQFMINGTSSLSTINGSFVIPNGRTLTQNFYVGAIGNRNVSTLSHTFLGRVYKGKIFKVMIYNRQLTNAELLQNYNATKAKYGF